MSSGPQTVVDANTYGVGAALKVGYTNGNDGATPLCHMGIFFRGLFRLLPISADLSSYTAMYAIDECLKHSYSTRVSLSFPC